jgi:hypothetical protein
MESHILVAGDSAPKQNWILDPLQDALFVILAPLLVLGVALAMFSAMGAVAATSAIIVAHIVFTVAHHLPTFIRVYGDVDLFRRFKWNFVLGPVVPLTFCVAVLGYIDYKNYPVEYFLYLYIMLVLWDPWHFLRQHYGFMRIYDRYNHAPRRIAARMDLALCVAWFVFIMLASGAWLADLLRDLQSSVNLPLLAELPAGVGALMVAFAHDAAILTTLAYVAYLIWCRQRGYFISVAKLALFVVTFGVMYLAYTPNEWILSVAPDWTFKVGFAAVGIVHMTQYLAIVWRHNRTLAKQPGRARSGWFQRVHSRGGWIVGLGYVFVCLAYGQVVTTERENRWLMSVLLAIGFTSTLMHYYFDGFIWKIRHQQNRDGLFPQERTLAPRPDAAVNSWWTSFRAISPRAMLLRQLGYFGVPMLLLSSGAVSMWNAPAMGYIDHMYRAQALSKEGQLSQARGAALQAYEAMREQLPAAQRLAEIDPTAAREAELAFLIYNHSYYQHAVLPSIEGHAPATAEHRKAAGLAAHRLEHALAMGRSIAHSGRERLTREDGMAMLASWRRIAAAH